MLMPYYIWSQAKSTNKGTGMELSRGEHSFLSVHLLGRHPSPIPGQVLFNTLECPIPNSWPISNICGARNMSMKRSNTHNCLSCELIFLLEQFIPQNPSHNYASIMSVSKPKPHTNCSHSLVMSHCWQEKSIQKKDLFVCWYVVYCSTFHTKKQ